MSNGNPQGGSPWPVIAIVAVIIALAVAGWDAMLQKHIKMVDERLKKVEGHLTAMENGAKAAEAAAAKARRKARAEAAAEGGGATPDQKSPGKTQGK